MSNFGTYLNSSEITYYASFLAFRHASIYFSHTHKCSLNNFIDSSAI